MFSETESKLLNKQAVNEDIVRVLAERFLKKENISDWAIKCLEKGFDSKSLRILAATNNFDPPSQSDEYFNRALEELNWNDIELQDYLVKYAKILATEIIENKVDPIIASRDIFQILIDLDYPPELQAWQEIDEMIWAYEYFLKTGEQDYFYRPKDELISEIKKVSAELIRSKAEV